MRTAFLKLSVMSLMFCAVHVSAQVLSVAQPTFASAVAMMAATGAAASNQKTTRQAANPKAAQPQRKFSQAELDQMLAPIALYPDTVLSHVLIAATYPLEIVKATRWLSSNNGMTSEQALKRAENEPWDPSVRALVAFPPLLTKMNNELEWTQRLGDAFLIQQADVMARIQELRQKAYKAGNLNDQEHVKVEYKEKVIVIEPRRPEVIYVPSYDTRVVYGNWWWHDYPPTHWPVSHYSSGTYISWGYSSRVAPSFYVSTFYWPRHEVVVINHVHRPTRYYYSHDIIVHEERRHWRHNPVHRHGVVYHTEYRPNYEPTREYYGGGGYNGSYDNVEERRRWSAQQREQQGVAMPGDDVYRQQAGQTIDTELRRAEVDAGVTEQSGRIVNGYLNGDRAAQMSLPQTQAQQDVVSEGPQRSDSDASLLQSAGGLSSVNEQRGVTETEQRGVTETQMPTDTQSSQQSAQDSHSNDGYGNWVQPQVIENTGAATSASSGPSSTDGWSSTESSAGTTQGVTTSSGDTWSSNSAETTVSDTTQPSYETPQPTYEAPQPVYETPQPVYEAPQPVYETPQPVYEAPQPTYEAPQPVYEAPQPVYEAPQPVYEAPQPVYEAPQPVYEAPQPVYEAPQPVYEAPQPVFESSAPVIETRQELQ
jgi:hypothetical protein